MVRWSDEQIGIIVFALETSRRAESIPPSPQAPLVRTQRQRFIAQSIMGLVAGAFIKVVEHDRVFVRLKRPSPQVVSM